MLLTVSTTHTPATDLGFLLYKHPDKAQTFPTSAGSAHVFYPEATAQRCTAALLLEVDPVALVRGERARFDQYVNDRPYVASSLLAVALRTVFGTAMSGRCAARPELAGQPLPLVVEVPAVSQGGVGHGGVESAERLFAPLGWEVTVTPVAPDPAVGGDPRYVGLVLRGELRLADALNQLYVLLPALDGSKHYGMSSDEVDKLLRAGAGWLAAHPDRELITKRYLRRRDALVRDALARLAEVDDAAPERFDPDAAIAAASETGPAAASCDHVAVETRPGIATRDHEAADAVPDPPVRPVPLAVQRRVAIVDVLRSLGAQRVGDLGCGEGALVAALLADRAFTRVVATDVSARALEVAARRLRLARMPDPQRERVELFQSSLVYRDERLRGLDAAVLCEVVEHVDPPRLPTLARVVFGEAAPGAVVVTTPNVEHNVRYDLPLGRLRHRDHRFEWTRAQFREWAGGVAVAYGYAVRYLPVGVEDPEVGPPTQMAVFTRPDRAGVAA